MFHHAIVFKVFRHIYLGFDVASFILIELNRLCPLHIYSDVLKKCKCAIHPLLKGQKMLSEGIFLFASMISLQKWWKNVFHFILKTLFVFKIFKFLSWPFGHVKKCHDFKDKINLVTLDVTIWLTNNYNTHIGQYFPN